VPKAIVLRNPEHRQVNEPGPRLAIGGRRVNDPRGQRRRRFRAEFRGGLATAGPGVAFAPVRRKDNGCFRRGVVMAIRRAFAEGHRRPAIGVHLPRGRGLGASAGFIAGVGSGRACGGSSFAKIVFKGASRGESG
jgi:hypothetical protein